MVATEWSIRLDKLIAMEYLGNTVPEPPYLGSLTSKRESERLMVYVIGKGFRVCTRVCSKRAEYAH